MVKATKKCELRVHLTTGACVRGRFHIEASTSSAVRPSDALREDRSGWLLLTDVCEESSESADAADRAPVLMLNRSAIAMIEILPNNWQV